MTAGTAQATMIAVVQTPRAHGPEPVSSSATRVPSATVRTTQTTAKTTVFGSTVFHSNGS